MPHRILPSGTRLPKGAILSHQKTFFNVLNAGIYFDLTSKDIAMIARPLFHSGGLIVEFAQFFTKESLTIIRKEIQPPADTGSGGERESCCAGITGNGLQCHAS